MKVHVAYLATVIGASVKMDLVGQNVKLHRVHRILAKTAAVAVYMRAISNVNAKKDFLAMHVKILRVLTIHV